MENSPYPPDFLHNIVFEMIKNNSTDQQFTSVFESLGCEVKFEVKV
jgi:hypothetical protein